MILNWIMIMTRNYYQIEINFNFTKFEIMSLNFKLNKKLTLNLKIYIFNFFILKINSITLAR